MGLHRALASDDEVCCKSGSAGRVQNHSRAMAIADWGSGWVCVVEPVRWMWLPLGRVSVDTMRISTVNSSKVYSYWCCGAKVE